jgi:hypothetical protein
MFGADAPATTTTRPSEFGRGGRALNAGGAGVTLVPVGTRLWTRWDTIALVAYEAVAIPVAFFVPGGWQLPAFLAGMVILGLIGRLVVTRTERAARLRSSIPRAGSAPWSLSFVAAVAAMVAVSLVLRGLGAGHSDGWLIIAVGAINPTVNVTDRWWTARIGTAA